VPVGDIEDYEVEEVGDIELDEDSEFELVSVRTHIANLRLAYDPDYEVIADIVDETEFVEELGIGVFDGITVDDIVDNIKGAFLSLFPSPEVEKMLNNMITVDKQKQKITIELPSASEDKQEISKPRKTSTRLIKCFMIRHCDAKGLYNPETGELTVLSGSKINDKYPEWIIQQYTQEAKNIKKRIDTSRKGNTEFQDGVLCVIKDITFKSPSGASSFCAASSTNGYDEWKDENGEKIAIYRHQKIRAPK
jgi:hypothetical protein